MYDCGPVGHMGSVRQGLGLSTPLYFLKGPALELNICLHRLGEVTEGAKKIPFIQEKETGKWYHDSDFIVPFFEDKFPERKLGIA